MFSKTCRDRSEYSNNRMLIEQITFSGDINANIRKAQRLVHKNPTLKRVKQYSGIRFYIEPEYRWKVFWISLFYSIASSCVFT